MGKQIILPEMDRPNLNTPFTDAKTYRQKPNQFNGYKTTIDWKRYANDLDKYIDYLEEVILNNS